MTRARLATAAVAALVLACAPPAFGAFRVEDPAAVSGSLGPAGQACPPPTPPRTSDHSLAIDPRNPRHLVAAWMQDRAGADTGGAQGLGVAVSRNGGESWSAARVSGITGCYGGSGADNAVNEAQVAIGYDGTAYIAGELHRGSSRIAFVTRSTDGGARWSPPTILNPADRFAGRESVAADPLRPRGAYVSWQSVEPSPLGALLSTSVLYAAETSGAGGSWSGARVVRRPGGGRYDIGPRIMRARDGSLVIVFNALSFANVAGPPFPGASRAPLLSVRSTDGGATWSPPVELGSIEGGVVADPDSGRPVNVFPGASTAQGPDGTLYVAWRTGRTLGPSRIEAARSRDGGASWTTLPPVATPPTQSFLPQIAVARNGVVGVSWYDFRGDRPGDGSLTTRVWFASSADRGTTWQEAPLAGPFDARPTLVGDLSLIGDTAGLVGTRDGFVASFNLGPPLSRRGLTDLFSARIRRCSVRVTAPVCDGPLRIRSVRIRPRSIGRRGRARLSFRLSRAAGISIIVERRLRRRRCTTPRSGRRRCSRYQRRRVLSLDGRTGRNSLRISGRRLPRGRYRVRLRAVDVIGARSPERRVRFRIR